jgi:hypothetical protein
MNITVTSSREYLRGKYHCTVDLLFDWFGISCMTTDNFCFYLQNRLIQPSPTGGQQYSDTSPFSIPCLKQTTFDTFAATKMIKKKIFQLRNSAVLLLLDCLCVTKAIPFGLVLQNCPT